MSSSSPSLSLILRLLSFAGCVGHSVAMADLRGPNATDDIQFQADRYRADLERGVTIATGNVKVTLGSQVMEAEEIEISGPSREVFARGKVKLRALDAVIEASEVRWNFLSGLGAMSDAKVVHQDRLQIEGRKVERYGLDRYRVIEGKLSTCFDCPQSWSLTGSAMDIQTEEYAEIHHASVQVLDQPVFYMPFLVFPVKSKRQSGFLFPTVEGGKRWGVSFGIPYFYVINDEQDLTMSYQAMTKGGHQWNGEHRWTWDSRSWQNSFLSYNANARREFGEPHRWALGWDHRWQWTAEWTQRSRLEWAGDARYIDDFDRLFDVARLPYRRREWSLTRYHPDYLWTAEVTVPGDSTVSDQSIRNRDEGFVGKAPDLRFALPTRSWLGGWLHHDFRWRATQFENIVGDGSAIRNQQVPSETPWFDQGFRSGFDSRWFSPQRLGVFVWEPSAQFRSDFYQVRGLPESALRVRSYVDQKLGPEFFRAFDAPDWTGFSRIRHDVKPFLRWSYAGPEYLSSSPFFSQSTSRVNGFGGPYFDVFDPRSSDLEGISLGSLSEEQRLRPHHLLTVGAETSWIGRRLSSGYDRFVSGLLARDYDLATGQYGSYFARANASVWQVNVGSEFTWHPEFGYLKRESRLGLGVWIVSLGAGEAIEKSSDVLTRHTSDYQIGVPAWGPYRANVALQWNHLTDAFEREIYEFGLKSESRCWTFALKLERLAGAAMRFEPKFSISFVESSQEFF